MSTLREAAQDALTAYETFRDVDDIDGLDGAVDRLRAALAQPEVEPPRDEWRETVHDELVATWTFSTENKDDPRKALQDIINWHVRVALDPAVSSDAQALIERGKAMRDGWRPASEPPEDLRRRVIAWRAPPQRKSGTWFEALYDDGAWITRDGIAYDVTHWRDVTPPTEGAK